MDKNFLKAEQNFLSPDYQKIRNKQIPDYFYYLNFKAAEQTAEKEDKKNEFEKWNKGIGLYQGFSNWND